MAHWYTRLAPIRSKTTRLRDARNKVRVNEQRIRKPLKIRDEKFVFYRTYCKDLHIGGYRSKVCTKYHIAKFFDVPRSTILRWDAAGVLPEPFMVQERSDGRKSSLYLSAQLRVLVIVVRDLVEDGYITIPWHLLDDHIAMLHEGYAYAARQHRKRLNAGDNIFEEKGDRFGVIFDD